MKRTILALACAAAIPASAGDIADAHERAAQLLTSPGLKAHFSPRGTVTEFYNATLKHYFRTVDPGEVAAIQNGAAGPGWSLTNDNFGAWTADFKPANALEVCRFYAAGPNSHFYTISASECAAVKLDPGWKYEGIAFYALAPNFGGGCSSEYAPVYRAYNDRFAFNDSNHRLTTSQVTYQAVIAQGWKGEGTAMCVPLPTTLSQQKTELLLGMWTLGPYQFGTRSYTDTLNYTDLLQSTTTPTIYAIGINKFGLGTLGSYVDTSGKWLMLSSYTASGGYPYDVYEMTIGPTFFMSGCYYFWFTSTASLGSCTPITGHR